MNVTKTDTVTLTFTEEEVKKITETYKCELKDYVRFAVDLFDDLLGRSNYPDKDLELRIDNKDHIGMIWKYTIESNQKLAFKK